MDFARRRRIFEAKYKSKILKISKVVLGFRISDMTSEGLGEMFECDSADMCAGKFPLVSMGGRADGLACADPGARAPAEIRYIIYIGPSGVRAPAQRSGH